MNYKSGLVAAVWHDYWHRHSGIGFHLIIANYRPWYTVDVLLADEEAETVASSAHTTPEIDRILHSTTPAVAIPSSTLFFILGFSVFTLRALSSPEEKKHALNTSLAHRQKD